MHLFDNTKYLGGTKIERDPKFRQQLKSEMYYPGGKNVYYSPGTIFWSRTQLEKIIKLAKNNKVNMFISKGRLFNIPENLPLNIKVYDWIDKETLKKLIPEMDLVLTQGLGLVTRTVRCGIPLLVDPIMPGNFQQAIKVNNYGNGIGLFENKISLEQAFEEILYKNPEKYKLKALQLQKEFSELGGALKAIELIKELAYSQS
jgi:UDP:flavonoid glycosyltransferase YjiC (YdhE family)